MQVHYLEIVTNEVTNTCTVYAQLYGVKFSDIIPELGNARKAALANGGMIGIRAPMHESEQPLIRPYMRVDDIEAALVEVVNIGAEIAHPAMEITGHGIFAIYTLGGIQYGLWQV